MSTALKFFQNLANDEKRRLMHFSFCAISFFIGYGMIYWINKNLPPSTKQELLALSMIALCALSFIYAMILQVLYILKRILK